MPGPGKFSPAQAQIDQRVVETRGVDTLSRLSAGTGSAPRAGSSSSSSSSSSPPPWRAPEEPGQGEKVTQGEARGQDRPRSPQMVQGAKGGKGKDERERIIVVVRSPYQENPADAHPSAHKSMLESANLAWTRSVHLDAPGQRHGQQPVSGSADPGVVKQEKSSRGSVDTTKRRSDPQRVGLHNGERPIGAANDNQTNHTASCQPAPPIPPAVHSQRASSTKLEQVHYTGGTNRRTPSALIAPSPTHSMPPRPFPPPPNFRFSHRCKGARSKILANIGQMPENQNWTRKKERNKRKK